MPLLRPEQTVTLTDTDPDPLSVEVFTRHVEEGKVSCNLDDKSKKIFDPAERASAPH